jgi:hypothetical protein
MVRDWQSVAGAKASAWGKSFHTMRKKDMIEFGYSDSGKTACFAVQIENGGKKGDWVR